MELLTVIKEGFWQLGDISKWSECGFIGVFADSEVLSTILCEIAFCQFLKEWQVLGDFSYGF